MCGIFVVYSKNGTKLSESKCFNASNDLYNRGPDHLKFEYFKKNSLFILNTILSITGKVKNDRKLEKSKTNRYSISFNVNTNHIGNQRDHRVGQIDEDWNLFDLDETFNLTK